MTNWVIGIDMYTLMCIKLMTNKDLLYKKINKIIFRKTTQNKSKQNKTKKKFNCKCCVNSILKAEITIT